ncbi:barstar family protein [Acidipila sp. EB88]|uniref:barstar family protein n=1 Tax=Acidipila sp. EB88 TaxID=2305226 RepID=UPI000F6015F8|nr:barstar family protein [Acidipila sp. EB88]RRA49352.1 hypothetical protein D1Y84_14755 [Acidipila sp. EB88]
MAIFLSSEQGAFDLRAIRDGGITLYRRHDILAEDTAWLGQVGYRIVRLDCQAWNSEQDMHMSLFSVFHFPDYYGMNLDALSDVFTEIEVPLNGGVALILSSYDQFANGAGGSVPGLQRGPAEALLVILSRASHEFLLTGRRFLTLVQSADPLLSFQCLGGHAASWNARELPLSNRSL